MAVNKRKILDAARKFAQKGAKQKALKEYQTLLKLDPRDAKLHLEIGDAYRRWGEVDEAIAQYLRVAEQYKEDGFDARAVAVFKQVLNLDSKRYSAYVSLSELYRRIGLDSEASAALQTAADGYHKEGKRREALDLLRKMAALDPSNTTNRLKVAELLRQEGMEEDAITEYEEVAGELDRQGAHDQLCPVYERILELQPDRVDVLLAIANVLVELNHVDRAETFARRVLELAPDEPAHYELMLQICRTLDKEESVASVTRQLAKLYKDRGDDDRSRELLQRLPSELGAPEEGEAPPPSAGGEASAPAGGDDLLIDDDLIDDNEFLDFDDQEASFAQGGNGGLAEDAAEATTPEAAEPEGDPEQLLAEASVYLRYGKIDQAIASLRAVVAQDANHRPALEKLGDAYSEKGQVEEAISVWNQAVDVANGQGDAEAVSLLLDRIRTLDPNAAAEPAGTDDPDDDLSVDVAADALDLDAEAEVDDAPEVEADLGPVPDLDDDLEVEIDSADVASDELAADEFVADEFVADEGADELLQADDHDDGGIEIEIAGDDEEDDDTDTDGDAMAEALRAAEAEVGGVEDETADDGIADDGIAIEIDAEDSSEDSLTLDTVGQQQTGSSSLSRTTAQRVTEELEEAEFYYSQSLLDEAEAVYRRILSIAPNHPSALLRLGEIAAERGEDPAAMPAADANEPVDGSDALGDTDEHDEDLFAAVDEATIPADSIEVDEEEAYDLGVEVEEEEDEELGVEVEDEVADDFDVAVEDTPSIPTQELELSEPEAEALPLEPAPEPEPESAMETQASGAPDEDDAAFDLGEALRETLTDEQPAAGASAPPQRNAGSDSFESIFADFKRGVSQTVSAGDYQTRFDLGLAYREMELYGDAIEEFRLCLESEGLRVKSLQMMGNCAFALGRVQDATNHLEQALALPDLTAEAMTALRFDLGRCCEAQGDLSRARSFYDAVVEADSNFPGIDERLEALANVGEEAVELDSSPSYESFDDLLSDAASEEEDEPFESFDDVITAVAEDESDAPRSVAEMTAPLVEPEPIVEAEPIVEPEPVVEAEPIVESEPVVEDVATPEPDAPKDGAPEPRSRSGRKKKISFV